MNFEDERQRGYVEKCMPPTVRDYYAWVEMLKGLQQAWRILNEELPNGIEFEVKNRERFIDAHRALNTLLGE